MKKYLQIFVVTVVMLTALVGGSNMTQAQAPAITILNPVGGEPFKVGNNLLVRFTTNLPVGTWYNVALSNASGTSYTSLTQAQVNEKSVQGVNLTIPNVLPGDYFIRVIEYGNCLEVNCKRGDSNFFTIYGPDYDATVKVLRNILDLKLSLLRQEVLLKNTVTISVAGGTKGIYVYEYPGSVGFYDGANNSVYANSKVSEGWKPATGGSQVVYDTDGNKMYYVKPGITVQFSGISTINPKQMFAGTYYTRLNSIFANTGTDMNSSFYFDAPENKSNTKTIVGEKSPYITSVTDPIKVGENMVVVGERLAAADIYIDGTERDPANVVRAKDGTSISFTLPNISEDYHYLYVKDSRTGESNRHYFKVGEKDPPIIACPAGYICVPTPGNPPVGNCPAGYTCTPTSDTKITVIRSLFDLIYDAQGQESLLKNTIVVSVNGGATGIYLRKDGGIAEFIDANGVASNAGSRTTEGFNTLTSAELVTGPKGSYYVIPPGMTHQFSLITTIQPIKMFAGTYYAQLRSVLVTANTLYDLYAFDLPANKSNTKTIVGEKSPYITSVTTPVKAEDRMSIRGLRLSVSDQILIDGVARRLDPGGSDTLIQFTLPSLTAGQHYLHVNDPATGDSNRMYFEVGDQTQPPLVVCPAGYICVPQTPSTPQIPSCPAGYTCTPVAVDTPPTKIQSIIPSAPVSGQTYNPAYPLKVSWNQNYASNAISIKLYGGNNSPRDLGTYPAKKGDNSITRQIANLNLSNGLYSLEICDEAIADPNQPPTKPLCGQVRFFNIETPVVAPTSNTLTLVKGGTNNGVVSTEGTQCTSLCTLTVPSDKQITITATPSNPTTMFAGWSGGGCSGTNNKCTVTISTSATVTAQFSSAFMTSVTKKGTGKGTVTGGDVNCGTTCTTRSALNSSVTLTATPEAGSVFTGWSGLCTGTGTCTVSSATAGIKSVTATFDTAQQQSASLQAMLVSVDEVVAPGTSANDDIGLFTIKYKLTAVGGDVYVLGTYTPPSVEYVVEKAGNVVTSSAILGVLQNNTDSASTTGGNYKIEEGDSETFTLTVSVPNGNGLIAGQYRMRITGIRWGSIDSNPSQNTYSIDIEDFHTDYTVLNALPTSRLFASANRSNVGVPNWLANILSAVFGN